MRVKRQRPRGMFALRLRGARRGTRRRRTVPVPIQLLRSEMLKVCRTSTDAELPSTYACFQVLFYYPSVIALM